MSTAVELPAEQRGVVEVRVLAVLTPRRAVAVDDVEAGLRRRVADQLVLAGPPRVVGGEQEADVDRRRSTPASSSSAWAPSMSTSAYSAEPLSATRASYVGAPGTVVNELRTIGVRVQRLDQAVDDVLAGDRLEERLAHLERRLGVAAVGRRVERATVVDDEVDVLVGAAVTGDDLDAAIGERLELGQDVGRRLRLDEVDLLVLHRLHRRRRVADDAVDDRRQPSASGPTCSRG